MAEKFQLKAILSVVDKLTPSLEGVEKVAAKARAQMSKIGGAVSGLAQKLRLPVGLGVSAAVGGLAMATKSAVDNFVQTGDELQKMRARTGLAADELQRLRYLAQQSDVSVEGLQGSVAKLNLNLAKAAAGKDKNLSALLQRLQIDPKKVKNGADLLPQIAEAFKRNESPMARARMGMALFGKGYAELLPMLVDGADAIKANEQRWRQIGYALTDADLDQAAAYGDSLSDLRMVLGSLGTMVGQKLVPVLAPAVEQLIQYITANREVFAKQVSDTVTALVEALKKVDWQKVLTSLSAMVTGIVSLMEMAGGLKTVLIGLGAVLLAGPVVAFGQLVLTMLGALKSFSLLIGLSNPVMAAIVGITVAAGLIIANWDKVKEWFGSFFDWIAEKFKAFTGWIGDLVRGAGRLLGLGGGPRAPAPGVSGAPSRQPLIGRPGGGVDGKLKIEFDNAPPGMRIADATNTPPFLVTNVGYRSFSGAKT